LTNVSAGDWHRERRPHDAYCQISSGSARAVVMKPNHHRGARVGLPPRRYGQTHPPFRSQLTAHWSPLETDFITVFMSSPTLRRLPVRAGRRSYVDCLVMTTTLTVIDWRRPAAWLLSLATCNPIIHQAPTAESWVADISFPHVAASLH